MEEPSVLREVFQGGHVIFWKSNRSKKVPELIAELLIALHLSTKNFPGKIKMRVKKKKKKEE